MRASDADRDQVTAVLRDAAAEGRITLEELEERLEQAYQARTYDDLAPVTADLPVSGRVGLRADTAALSQPDEPLEISEMMGNIVRKGKWRVPSRVTVKNPAGNTRLDFREAVFASSVVHLQIATAWGHTILIFPRGFSAEVDVETSWMGSVVNRVDEVSSEGSVHFKVTGECKGGGLWLRYGRTKKK